MTLKVFYDLMSQPSRALIIFLRKNQIPFEDKRVKLGSGEHHTKEYEQVNRFKRVPAIEDGDFKLIESVAILRYLCREKNVADHWYPKDSKQMARVDEFLEYQHIDLRLHCALYFQIKYLRPILTGKEPNEKHLAEFKGPMVESLNKIENLWLKNNPYIVGNQISIADIVAACEIEQMKLTGYNPNDGRPLVNKWFTRIKAELNPHYDEAHKFVYMLAERERDKGQRKPSS